MVGWHHRLNGHGFGWTPGVGDGQGGLVCCSSWGHKELDTTELNWLYSFLFFFFYLVAKSCWIAACQVPLSMGFFQARITGVGCHFLLQGIFLTQGSNQGLLHCRQILSQLNYQGTPGLCSCTRLLKLPGCFPWGGWG